MYGVIYDAMQSMYLFVCKFSVSRESFLFVYIL